MLGIGTPPDVAVSNLSLWMSYLGLDRLASFVAAPETDLWVYWIAAPIFILLVFWNLFAPEGTTASVVEAGQPNGKEPTKADFAAWDGIPRLMLWQVAYLWEGKEPLPNRVDLDLAPMLTTLKQAVEDARLEPTGDAYRNKNKGTTQWMVDHPELLPVTERTTVTRDALKAYAESIGEQPPFLYPEKRHGRWKFWKR